MPPISDTPSFSIHGSKSIISKYITSLFPNNINTFHDIFAGRLNITFRLKTTKNKFVEQYRANDLYNSHWMKSLKSYNGNWDFLENEITPSIFQKWRDSQPSIERDLMEAVAVYHGNYWERMNSANNYALNSRWGSLNFKSNWTKKYKLAHRLIQDVIITGYDWYEYFQHTEIKSNDVIYCDPPYLSDFDCSRTYPSISHEKFLDFVLTLNCKVFISGYWSELYMDKLNKWKVHKKTRYSTAKQRQGTEGKNIQKVEYIWENIL
jgi:site-specific DNA-adenine methylase